MVYPSVRPKPGNTRRGLRLIRSADAVVSMRVLRINVQRPVGSYWP
jgi:hypothetical protein